MFGGKLWRSGSDARARGDSKSMQGGCLAPEQQEVSVADNGEWNDHERAQRKLDVAFYLDDADDAPIPGVDRMGFQIGYLTALADIWADGAMRGRRQVWQRVRDALAGDAAAIEQLKRDAERALKRA